MNEPGERTDLQGSERTGVPEVHGNQRGERSSGVTERAPDPASAAAEHGARPGEPGNQAGRPVGPPVLVLVGAPGAGKTTVGRLVADRLGVPFRDTDADIEQRAGKPIPEIFVDDGEPAFRALEVEAVAAGLAGFPGVLALGGGAVLNEATQHRLAGHTVVYLAVSAAEAAGRVGLNRDRPLLLGNVRAQLKALLDERLPAYQKVATATVPTDGRPAADVATAVLDAIRPRVPDAPSAKPSTLA